MQTRKLLIVFLLHLAIAAGAQTSKSVPSACYSVAHEYQQAYFSQELGYTVPNDGNFLLYDTLSTWLGTPYRFAGNYENGIDCSGFVNLLYDRVYGISLGARNSAEIYTLVEKIDSDELQEGDLVFFGIRSRSHISHVGIYLGQRKFVHASTSRGVIVSDLDEPYYKKYFVGGGRNLTVSRRLVSGNPD